MAKYFSYLKDMLIAFFTNLGTFFVTLFAAPWNGEFARKNSIKDDFHLYGQLFDTWSGQWGTVGWIFFGIFAVLFLCLLGGVIFLLVFLFKKYVYKFLNNLIYL